MRFIHIFPFVLALLLPAPSAAADYVPVDELGKNLAIPRLQRPRHYNQRLHGRMPYNPRMYGRIQMPRDPNIGKWVSPPEKYTHEKMPAGAAPVRLLAAAAQTSGASPNTASSKPKLFGTVEFGKPLSTLPGWLDVLKRNERSPIFQAEKYFNRKTNWAALRDQAGGLSKIDQLRLVNRFWNTFPYKEDMANWGQPDYWAVPAEFLRKSGDCEDYAIVKYFTLKELGFDPHKMRIVVLRDTVRNLPHAVLAVFMDNDIYILDNLTTAVLSHKRMGNYSPQYSVNEYGRWAHIKTKSRKR